MKKFMMALMMIASMPLMALGSESQTVGITVETAKDMTVIDLQIIANPTGPKCQTCSVSPQFDLKTGLGTASLDFEWDSSTSNPTVSFELQGKVGKNNDLQTAPCLENNDQVQYDQTHGTPIAMEKLTVNLSIPSSSDDKLTCEVVD